MANKDYQNWRDYSRGLLTFGEYWKWLKWAKLMREGLNEAGLFYVGLL